MITAVLIALCALSPATHARPSQDIISSVGVFISRPRNPPVDRSKIRREKRQLGARASGSRPDKARGAAPAESSPAGQESDTTEDALWLGNAARDATPPRYGEAERAYLLAAKLAPADPRPQLGLGNILSDQGRHVDAAKAFKKAAELALLAVNNSGPLPAKWGDRKSGRGLAGPTRAGAVGIVGALPDLSPLSVSIQSRASLGGALLQAGEWQEAEETLRDVTREDSPNAQAHAMLGLALLNQGKYSEAEAVFRRAVKLAPRVNQYKELLKQTRRGSGN